MKLPKIVFVEPTAKAASKSPRQPKIIQDVVPNREITVAVKPHTLRWVIISGATFLFILIAFFVILGWTSGNKAVTDPVPFNIRKSVDFDVYYPRQSKLPGGYKLNQSSFTVTSQVVVYEITGPGGVQLVVSDEKAPSADQIQAFYANHLPLNIKYQTGIGTATIGVINSESIASLPTNNGVWLLVTAPLNFDQATFEKVLSSFVLAS